MKPLALYGCVTLLATVSRIVFGALYYNRYNSLNAKSTEYFAAVAAAHRPGAGRQVFALNERDTIILKNAPIAILSVVILSSLSLAYCILVLFLRKHHEKTSSTGKHERTIYTLGHITAILFIICTVVCVFTTVVVTFSATSVMLRNVEGANDVVGNSVYLETALDCQMHCRSIWANARTVDQRLAYNFQCMTCKTVVETAMVDSKFIFVCLISLIIEAVVVLFVCPCLNAKKTQPTPSNCYRMPKEIINPLLLHNGSKETIDWSNWKVAV